MIRVEDRACRRIIADQAFVQLLVRDVLFGVRLLQTSHGCAPVAFAQILPRGLGPDAVNDPSIRPATPSEERQRQPPVAESGRRLICVGGWATVPGVVLGEP